MLSRSVDLDRYRCEAMAACTENVSFRLDARRL
jgi:hypothetical protein